MSSQQQASGPRHPRGNGGAVRPVLVLGLDGASFDVIEPLARAGRLPNLARWMEEGASLPLRSTVPAMSFPAWSTLATGLDPGRHGLFDFTQKIPGAYRIRFSNATDRRGETLFSRVSRAGARVLCLGMPATFPPEPVNGLLVSGFDAPISVGSDARAASDPTLYNAIASKIGPWMTPDLDEGASDGDWRERAAERLPQRVERKKRFALEALDQLARQAGGRPDLAMVIFSESDTVSHHFWRDHDPDSPRHDPDASLVRRAAVGRVYEALDRACGELRDAFGRDALCIVLSDHGSGGASRNIVHLGRRLAECGFLERASSGGDFWARHARDLALRALPPRLAERVFRRVRGAAARIESMARFGGIDWSHTSAFSEEANTQPGIWVNLQGREASGSVAPADYERVRSELIDCLRDWKLPDGGPVVARAWRREEVHSGPYVDRAPDIVLELADDAGYGLSLVPTPWREHAGPSVRTLDRHELAGGRGRGMNGTHRPEGVWIATGAEAARLQPTGTNARPSLRDVAPTILGAMGIPWTDRDEAGPDGGDFLEPRRDYTPEEEERVAARLRALGYLE